MAFLTGAQEVSARDTTARGYARLRINDLGTELEFKVVVDDIMNVRASHIHCAGAGVNGPIGVTLFTGCGLGPAPDVLAHSVATAPDAGNTCGWATLADVVAALRSGDTYVNVHTNDGVDPGNTGPGDFQSGEIRGQVR